LKTLTVLGVLARSRTQMWRKSKPRVSTCMDPGERCRSRAPHKPRPRKPLASNSLARLKEPSPQSPRRWLSWAQEVAAGEVGRVP
jgi:hypothetical protein